MIGERGKSSKSSLMFNSSLFTTVYSCLAHIINLATQALILTYSRAPHFDPKDPEAHIPTSCDKVGLVRAIVVKVRFNHLIVARTLTVIQEQSSSKRKEMWKTVQSKAGIPRPVQLLLDMKVRWSSTYLMLDRAERNKAVSTYSMNFSTISIHFFVQSVDIFVDELCWEETDLSKHDKIRALKLDNDEWQRVNMFLGLLSVCLLYIPVV
jgi:hypothetical protein